MIPVKRNGVFQYTERLEANDIPLIDRPDEEAELNEDNVWFIDPEKIRKKKINKLKKEIEAEVYSRIPLFKQINAALGIYDDKTKNQIIKQIKAVVKAVDEAEHEIKAVSSGEKLRKFAFDKDKILQKADDLAIEMNEAKEVTEVINDTGKD
jgi:hypothetical protein